MGLQIKSFSSHQVREDECQSNIEQHKAFLSCWDEISAHISACKETLTENENDKGDKQTLALRLDKLMVSARGICLL